jgi:hypothetical protein
VLERDRLSDHAPVVVTVTLIARLASASAQTKAAQHKQRLLPERPPSR